MNSARSTRLSSLSRSSQLQERALLVLRQRGGRPGVDCIEEREQLEVLCQVHLRKYITSLSLGSHSAGSTQNTCTKSTHQQQPEFASRHVIVASATSSLPTSDRQGGMLPLFLHDAKYPSETQKTKLASDHRVGPFRSLKRPHDRRLAFEQILKHRTAAQSPASQQTSKPKPTSSYLQPENVVHALVHLGKR